MPFPEFGPDYVGALVGKAMTSELGRASIGESDWIRWQPILTGLVETVLDWPGAGRARSIALVVAKHHLGLTLTGREDLPSGDLATRRVELGAAGPDAFLADRPTVIQATSAGRPLGLVFMTGLEQEAGVDPVQAVLDQSADMGSGPATRALVSDPAFWRGVATEFLARTRQAGLPLSASRLKSDIKASLSRGLQFTLARGAPAPVRGTGVKAGGFSGGDGRKVPILMYHRVADVGDPALARYRVSPQDFQAQMGWLKAHGFTPLSLDDLSRLQRSERDVPARPVLITFDDGYLDFYDHAWAVLKEMSFSSVMFIVPGKVGQVSDWDVALGRSEPLMTWGQIADIAASGVSIGSHSMTHRRFSRLSLAEAQAEMWDSAAIIEDKLGRLPLAFCYPYGVYDRMVERLLPVLGYQAAFTCDPGAATLGRNPLRYPRIEVMGSHGLDGFVACLRESLAA
ncbi:MAG: polysaccharide deacetylase family protein [Alsobacter sp.]